MTLSRWHYIALGVALAGVCVWWAYVVNAAPYVAPGVVPIVIAGLIVCAMIWCALWKHVK